MAEYSESHITGRTTTMNADAKMGVIQQNVESTDTSITRTTNGDLAFGVPICIRARINATADGTVNVAVFDGDCPEKYAIVHAEYIMRDHREGGTPAHTLQLFHGDGAASESFNAITGQIDVDAAANGVVDTPYRFDTFTDAYDTIDVGESLRIQLIVGGTTDAEYAYCEVYLVLLPVRT